MKYFSTFTGIGGFELGIGPKHECVGYSEVDKYACAIYSKHFPKHHNYGDITKIDETTLPDFDLLVGGFPCQAFSIAGKRKGFEDTRGTLFFDVARILRAKRPRLLLLENVKGLLSHDGGRTFSTIIAALDELGYDLQWQVLNSKNHGVPQNRERVLIAGHLRGTPRPEVFPLTGSGRARALPTAPTEKVVNVAQTLTARQFANWGGNYVEEKVDPTLLDVSYPSRVREYRETAPTVRDYGSGGNKMPMVVQRGRGKNAGGVHAEAPALTGKSYQDNNHVFVRETGDGFHLARTDKKKSSVQGTHVTYPEGTAHCLNTNHKPMVLARNQRGEVRKMPISGSLTKERSGTQFSYLLDPDAKIRRLTPIECERLQGFPDGWTGEGLKRWEENGFVHEDLMPISDTQRYKTLGNAVTVNVIRDVTRKML